VPRILGGTVGPRVTADELRALSDEDQLALCDVITDKDEESFRGDMDIARSGGVREQARAFRDMMRTQPERGPAMLVRLQPETHQRYATAILEGMAHTLSITDLFSIARELDGRGFTSHEHRARVAALFEEKASTSGLPDDVIALLDDWLIAYPSEPDYAGHTQGSSDRPHPIVVPRFGAFGATTPIPHRSQIAAAIGRGLLARPEPALDEWLALFRREIAHEESATFWWHLFGQMALAFNERTADANAALTMLFSVHDHLLRDRYLLLFLGHFMPRLEPEHVRTWIAPLRDGTDAWEQQAYGELVMLANVWHRAAWTEQAITDAIALQNDAQLTGMGFVAPRGWIVPRLRALYATILATIAGGAPSLSTAALHDFLTDATNERVDAETEMIIRAALRNEAAVRGLVNVLAELAEVAAAQTPQLARDIADRVLAVLGDRITDLQHLRVAAMLTSVAMTLHRQPRFRAAGLELFERLLARSVRDADAALEILDRRPILRHAGHIQPRRRFRRGRGRTAS
jgi:hypothetical protein